MYIFLLYMGVCVWGGGWEVGGGLGGWKGGE